MTMKKLNLIVLAMSAIIALSCSSGSESDIAPAPNSNPNPNPNPTPSSITYTNTIKGIMTANCTSCHGSTPSNGASISLDTYARVKTSTQNNLAERISRAQGTSGMMPQGRSRLPQSTIDMVVSWSNSGYVE